MQTFLVYSGPNADCLSATEVLSRFEKEIPTEYDNRSVFLSPSDQLFSVFYETTTELFPHNSTYIETPNRVTFFDNHIWPKNHHLESMSEMAAILNKELENFGVNRVRATFLGEYSVVTIHKSHEHVSAFVDIAGMSSLYYYQGTNFAVIANRVGLINQVLASREDDLNIENLSHFVTWGFLPQGKTIYTSIKSLGANQIINLKDGKITIDQTGRPYLDIPGAEDFKEINDDVWNSATEEILTNIRFIGSLKNSYVCFGLSGGKDSRVVLSALLKEDLAKHLYIFTNGIPEHPDVIVASEITSQFGLFHHIKEPRQEAVDPFTILDEVIPKHLAYCEGLSCVFEPNGASYCGLEPLLTGLNGENFRAMFDAHIKDSSQVRDIESVLSYITENIWLDPAGIVEEPFKKLHLQEKTAWAMARHNEGLSPADILCQLHTEWHSLRRNNAFRKIECYNRHLISPLMAPTLYWLVKELGAQGRREERIHFELTKRFCPWLAYHHFADQSWHPNIIKELANPIAHPITAASWRVKKQIHSSDWRKQVDDNPNFRATLKDYLLSIRKDSIFWQIVNRKKLEDWFLQETHPELSRFCFYGAVTIAMILDKKFNMVKMKKVGKQKPLVAKSNDDKAIYQITNGMRRRIPNMEEFNQLGCSLNDVMIVPETILNRLPQG